MPRTAARITQADVARAIRAAMQAGAGPVVILPDGTIRIEVHPNETPLLPPKEIAEKRRIIL